MGLGAVLFAWSHVQPWGPAGMAAFFAGVGLGRAQRG